MSKAINGDHIKNWSLIKRQQLCKELDIEAGEIGGDFATFAAYLGMKNADLARIRQSPQPTEKILQWWERKPEATVDKLESVLTGIGRLDCVEILKEDEQLYCNSGMREENGEQRDGSSTSVRTAQKPNSDLRLDSPDGPTSTNSGAECINPPTIKQKEFKARNIEWGKVNQQFDVLLITVNDEEFKAATRILSSPQRTDTGRRLGPFYFGKIGKNIVALVRSAPGATGKAAVQATCQDAIEELSPKVIVLLGVCFGMSKDKQNLGDLIVASQAAFYCQGRMNKDGSLFVRSSQRECEARLQRAFQDGKVNWNAPGDGKINPKVHFGLVLSRPQLIDNEELKEELRKEFPEAIGGEMDAEGVYSLCDRYKIPWILCKSIADWADGNKNKNWQAYAAAVSASFVEHVLGQTYLPGIGKIGYCNEPPRQPAIDTHLRISTSVLCDGVAAGGLYALYTSSDSTKEKITSILINTCERFVNGRIDPEIMSIVEGSLRVILRCYSQQSFLQFLDDYETGRVKERLNEEFSKIGIGNVILEIANAEEIKEKKKNLAQKPNSDLTLHSPDGPTSVNSVIQPSDEITFKGGQSSMSGPLVQELLDWEIGGIAKRIGHNWKQVALLINLSHEIDDTSYSIENRDETSKFLDMLIRYRKMGGTRENLARALNRLKLYDVEKKVKSGYFVHHQ